jgi:hypothetical protein
MTKTLIVKLDSRKHSSEALESSIIEALQNIGLEHDGSDTSFDGEFNRNLFFNVPKNIDFEVVEDDFEDDDES